MEQFEDIVKKDGVASALAQEAAHALSHPLETANSLKVPVAEAAGTVAVAYLAHKFGPGIIAKGAETLAPVARELGATLKMDALTGFGPQFALAGGSHLSQESSSLARLIEKAKPASDLLGHEKPMLMATTGSGSGSAAEAMNYRIGTNESGETIHSFNNIRVPNTSTNHFAHADKTVVHFGHEGGLYIQFDGSPTYRNLDFSKPINSVAIKERLDGIKEYRFNNEQASSLLVNSATHDIVGFPANGDRIHIADNNSSGLTFRHPSGSVTQISPDGQVAISMANGTKQNTDVGVRFSQAFITDHKDGAISMRFSDEAGQMISGEIRVAPVASIERKADPKNFTPTPARASWRSPFARFSRTPNTEVDAFRTDLTGHGHHHDDVLNPFNIPMSPERAIDAKLTGVSGGVMSGSRLDEPAEMFTAQLGYNRSFTRWLENLGRPEDNY